MASPKQFADEVDKWTKKAQNGLLAAKRAMLRSLVGDIVRTTPIDTGQLQSSWYAGINSVPRGVIGASPHDWPDVINRTYLKDTFYLTNVAPYAMRIEFGFVGTDSLGRKYNQAGRYWVAAALARHRAAIQGILNAQP